jgi:hypothetical protein
MKVGTRLKHTGVDSVKAAKQLERAAAQEAVYEAPIAEEAKPKKRKW